MKLSSSSVLLILLFSHFQLQTCSAEINPPARKLLRIWRLPKPKLPHLPKPGLPHLPKPRLPPLVPRPMRPINSAPKPVSWKGKLPDILSLVHDLGSALCDHIVADNGVVECAVKGFCKLPLLKGLCGDRRCSYLYPDSKRSFTVTYMQRTCGRICYSYYYNPTSNLSSCTKWIDPVKI